MTSWLNSIDDIKLRESIQQLLSAYPDSLPVVQNLVTYYNDKLASATTTTTLMQQDNGRENKKRKIDSPITTSHNEAEEQRTVVMNDISFQLPARKKYNLVFTSTRRLYLINTKTEEIDYTFDLNHLQQICCVPSPVPTKGHTFTLFFKEQPMDPIVFTIQQKGDITIIQPQAEQKEQQQSVLTDDKEKHIIEILSEQTNHEIQLPSKSFYLSTVVSATTGKRPDDDRFYANVYLKNKEACLYFLPKGILFGFKKPVYYFPLTILSSTFYSGITQHTFNLTLVLKKQKLPLGSIFNISKDHQHHHEDDDEQESGSTLEFSMIEQSEFAGIDQYIKKMGINDKSMSEENMAPETKAKKQQQGEGKTSTALNDDSNNHDDDDDDEENDDDFEPSDDDDEPLEYDTDAGSSQQESSDDNNNNDDDDDDDDDLMDEDIQIETNKKRQPMDGIDEIDDSRDEGEQDITKTDNEDEEEDDDDNEVELGEDDDIDEVEDEEEDLQEDDAESESLGSGSEDDIDEDMREAKSRNIIPEDAKDELEDSD